MQLYQRKRRRKKANTDRDSFSLESWLRAHRFYIQTNFAVLSPLSHLPPLSLAGLFVRAPARPGLLMISARV
jgi:hypothetical protein